MAAVTVLFMRAVTPNWTLWRRAAAMDSGGGQLQLSCSDSQNLSAASSRELVVDR
jgi:hypothetical protein